MTDLILPAPQLVLDPPDGPQPFEKPVTVKLPSIALASGEALAPDQILTVGAVVYRGAAASEEIWDEGAKAWRTPVPTDAVTLAGMKPLGLSAAPGAPGWTGTLVAAGQKDGAGNARFAKAMPYRVRIVATALRDGRQYRGISPASADLSFVSMADTQRFAISFDTEDPATAETVRLALRNRTLQPAGYIEIRAQGGQEVEIANVGGSGTVLARVVLSADGSIRLRPASGRAIVLEGALEADRISYLPQGGGGRQTL